MDLGYNVIFNFHTLPVYALCRTKLFAEVSIFLDLFKHLQQTLNELSLNSRIPFDVHRNQFLSCSPWTILFKLSKKRSIEVIEFISCQHASLTVIMDLLNVCYSFQVLMTHFRHNDRRHKLMTPTHFMVSSHFHPIKLL